MLNQDEIDRRKPVWTALSELWLDTELQDRDLQAIAEVLRASGYSVAELREIYRNEVAPVVYENLRAPAGAWAGFDPKWLCAEAEKWAQNRSRTARLKRRLLRRTMTAATQEPWDRLERLLSERGG
jgi:hypothetical protein